MPAGNKKQPHTSKLAVAVLLLPIGVYLIAFAKIIQ